MVQEKVFQILFAKSGRNQLWGNSLKKIEIFSFADIIPEFLDHLQLVICLGPLFLFDSVHDLADRHGQFVNFNRPSLVFGFTLAAFDPFLLHHRSHSNAYFGLPEVCAPLNFPGRCLRCVGEIDKDLCDVTFLPYPDEEVCKFLFTLGKIKNIF